MVPHRMFFMVPASVCSRYLETYQYFGWLIISLIGHTIRVSAANIGLAFESVEHIIHGASKA